MNNKELKDIYNNCKNHKNLCKSCYEFCDYRENLYCELNSEDIRKFCIKEISKLDDNNFTKGLDYLNDLSKLVEFTLKSNKEYCENKKTKAVYCGSFDPFTEGHFDIVKQGCKIFDELHILIAINESKKERFLDKEVSKKAIEKLLKNEGIYNCKVLIYDGLIAEYCAKENIYYSIRGLRDTMDFNYEEQISNINSEINPDLKTIYFRAERNVSSSMVKTLYKHGKDISKYIPSEILNTINNN